eukprot:COSAG02_NODE_4134_length_5737_cov_3.273679_2_plen_69_part_00
MDNLDKERKQQERQPAETQEEATADLNRIRTALTSHWENGQRTLIIARGARHHPAHALAHRPKCGDPS